MLPRVLQADHSTARDGRRECRGRDGSGDVDGAHGGGGE